MRVLIEVIDAVCIKQGTPPLYSMNLVALVKKKLSQISTVLPGDARN